VITRLGVIAVSAIILDVENVAQPIRHRPIGPGAGCWKAEFGESRIRQRGVTSKQCDGRCDQRRTADRIRRCYERFSSRNDHTLSHRPCFILNNYPCRAVRSLLPQCAGKIFLPISPYGPAPPQPPLTIGEYAESLLSHD
jgi:hypothetical protein